MNAEKKVMKDCEDVKVCPVIITSSNDTSAPAVSSAAVIQQPLKQPPLPIANLKSEYSYSSERQMMAAVTEKELIKKRERQAGRSTRKRIHP